MATPSQRFNGEGSENNRVTVDFDKRSVKFQPISKFGLFNLLYAQFVALATIFVKIGFLLMFIRIYMQYIGYHHTLQDIINIYQYFVFAGIISVSVPALSFNRRFREKHFPVINAIIISFYMAFKGQNVVKRLKIGPEHLKKGKTYEIEHFYNIMLTYKATGDMAEKIKRIEIKEKELEGNHWKALFTFKQKVKSGQLSIRYI